MVVEDAEVIYKSCAGLDVHKDSIKVGLRKIIDEGKLLRDVQSFGTTTREILRMSDWLAEQGVTHIAMESTGVYWKPVWNLLEGRFQLLLVNPQHLKNVPGRKTDVSDCEWIAKCLQMGMLRASFVPEPPLRELRDLTRHRSRLVEQKASVINRIQKTLEDCNIKLASVATDVVGVSARQMIQSIISGQTDPVELAELAKDRMRKKIPQLQEALEGRIREHHRFMLEILLTELESFEDFIEKLNQHIEKTVLPFEEAVQLFCTTTGIQLRTAQNVVAECGINMTQFPTDRHFTSWLGLCPGNNESAGKRKSGKTTHGNVWAKKAFVEAASAASRCKGSYFQAQFRRLAPRRGVKRAIIAVAHSLAACYYHIIKDKTPYKDLGPDHFYRLKPKVMINYYVRKLEKLGYKVSIEAA